MMMILGLFPFLRRTTPYQTLEHQMTWRHVKNERVGQYARYQYIGPGEDKLTISGDLYPEITGGDLSLTMLNLMAASGKAWPLIDGTGRIYGMYVITAITETRSAFFDDGKARHIAFTVNLERVNSDMREMFGQISEQIDGLTEKVSSAASSAMDSATSAAKSGMDTLKGLF
ncbi:MULTISPECIES: phage tail protein [Dickeya]|uniref:Phage-related tail protein n=1 Tax=Dickeya aquatica TaxID=1401087 RepID=A0A375A9X3_9GAMM|nr:MULTISPECIES: phage tail protein [Dickeya]SLM62815.1 Phage-related tail protein [Dickeya aquatica]